MALKHVEKIDLNFRPEKFRELSQYVARASNRPIPPWKPIVGASLFWYESGSRSAGVIDDPTTFEVFSPEDVGLRRRFVLGKYSGVASLRLKLSEHGITVSNEEAALLICRLRSKSMKLKRALFDAEVVEFYEELIGEVREEVAAMKATGAEAQAEACVAAAEIAERVAGHDVSASRDGKGADGDGVPVTAEEA